MRVKIHFQYMNGDRKIYTKEYTVKEARKIYAHDLKNDKEVVYAFLSAFGEWRRYCYCILKDIRKIKLLDK